MTTTMTDAVDIIDIGATCVAVIIVDMIMGAAISGPMIDTTVGTNKGELK